eukprot:scpid81162/ scgid14934/ 
MKPSTSQAWAKSVHVGSIDQDIDNFVSTALSEVAAHPQLLKSIKTQSLGLGMGNTTTAAAVAAETAGIAISKRQGLDGRKQIHPSADSAGAVGTAQADSARVEEIKRVQGTTFVSSDVVHLGEVLGLSAPAPKTVSKARRTRSSKVEQAESVLGEQDPVPVSSPTSVVVPQHTQPSQRAQIGSVQQDKQGASSLSHATGLASSPVPHGHSAAPASVASMCTALLSEAELEQADDIDAGECVHRGLRTTTTGQTRPPPLLLESAAKLAPTPADPQPSRVAGQQSHVIDKPGADATTTTTTAAGSASIPRTRYERPRNIAQRGIYLLWQKLSSVLPAWPRDVFRAQGHDVHRSVSSKGRDRGVPVTTTTNAAAAAAFAAETYHSQRSAVQSIPVLTDATLASTADLQPASFQPSSALSPVADASTQQASLQPKSSLGVVEELFSSEPPTLPEFIVEPYVDDLTVPFEDETVLALFADGDDTFVSSAFQQLVRELDALPVLHSAVEQASALSRATEAAAAAAAAATETGKKARKKKHAAGFVGSTAAALPLVERETVGGVVRDARQQLDDGDDVHDAEDNFVLTALYDLRHDLLTNPPKLSSRLRTDHVLSLWQCGVVIGEQEARIVDQLTRSQSLSPLWMRYRQERITASNFGVVCRRKSTHAPASLLSCILGRNVNNVPLERFDGWAMQWGKDNEHLAIRRYEQLFKRTVRPSGLVINPALCWLGASPDGLVSDFNESAGHRGLVEVKCPYKYRHQRIENVCTDKLQSLEMVNGVPTLKRNHQYYYQIMGQLAVTERQWCDYIVFTRRDIHVERIYFDEAFWSEMLATLTNFFFNHIVERLPYCEHMPDCDDATIDDDSTEQQEGELCTRGTLCR